MVKITLYTLILRDFKIRQGNIFGLNPMNCTGLKSEDIHIQNALHKAFNSSNTPKEPNLPINEHSLPTLKDSHLCTITFVYSE
jgi:hypothetical protein